MLPFRVVRNKDLIQQPSLLDIICVPKSSVYYIKPGKITFVAIHLCQEQYQRDYQRRFAMGTLNVVASPPLALSIFCCDRL